MNARDSDDDLRDFMPDMAAIRREIDPAYAEKKLKEALNNPELDRALAEVRALKEKEATMTASSIKAPATPSGAAPPHRAAMGAPPRRTRRLSAWAVYALAVLAALVPAGLVFVLVKREPPAAQVSVPEGSGPASVNAAATPPAVRPPEDAAADAGAPVASTASANEPMGLGTPPLPAPTGAPLNKGSAPPRAGSAAPWPKGPALGRPKPPSSSSPRTTPLKENEYLP